MVYKISLAAKYVKNHAKIYCSATKTKKNNEKIANTARGYMAQRVFSSTDWLQNKFSLKSAFVYSEKSVRRNAVVNHLRQKNFYSAAQA